jgi:zinc protease
VSQLRSNDAWVRHLHEDSNNRAVSLLTASAYGEAHRMPPNQASLAAMDPEDTRDWLNDQFTARRAVLVLSGKISASPELYSEVERWLGGWRAGPPRAPPGRRPEPGTRRVFLLDAPGAPRAHVKVAVRLPARAEADPAAERVLAQIFELRLARLALPRGEAGARLAGFADDPLLVGELRLPRDAAAEGVRAALDMLGGLAGADRVDAQDANLARWLVAREQAYAADSLRGATRIAQALWLEGRLGPGAAVAPALASVDAERIGRAAAAARIGREIVVVVGDAATLEPALRAIGLAPERVALPAAKR